MVADHSHHPRPEDEPCMRRRQRSPGLPTQNLPLAEGAGTAHGMAYLVPPAFPVDALIPDERAADVVSGVPLLLGRGPRTGPATANRKRCEDLHAGQRGASYRFLLYTLVP